MAETLAAKQFPFTWEAKDVRGTRIRGKTMAVNEAAVRATLRRQGLHHPARPLHVTPQANPCRDFDPSVRGSIIALEPGGTESKRN